MKISFPTYEPTAAETAAQIQRYKAAVTDPNPLNQKILGLIVDLGNSILAKRAAADLHGYVLASNFSCSLIAIRFDV